LFFIEFLQKRKNIFLLLHWAAFTIALFCKETAAILPILFVVYFFAFSSEKRFEKKYFFIIMLYAVSGMFWFWLRSKAIGDYSTPDGTFGLMPLLSNVKVIPEALAKFFLPFDFSPIPGFSILKISTGLGIIIIIIIISFKNRVRLKKEIIFCFSWFLLLMLPPMLFKHPYIDYLDHRFFLPMIGILLYILLIVPEKWFKNGDIKRLWILIAIFIILCSFTFIKARSYSDPMTFYNSAVLQNSNSAMAYNNRGYIKYTMDDIKGAIGDYSKAIAICPTYDEAYNNRGYAKLLIGDKSGAIEDFNSAISINNKNAEAYNNRGAAKMGIGNFQDAIEDYNKAIALRPNYAEAYNNKGIIMNSTGRYSEAMIYLNKAIEIDPNHLNAYGNRSITKYHLKDFAGAIEDCERILKQNPDDKRALNLKAKAQQELQKVSH
jgi:Flp pilus assembly protein TadD